MVSCRRHQILLKKRIAKLSRRTHFQFRSQSLGVRSRTSATAGVLGLQLYTLQIHVQTFLALSCVSSDAA